MWIALVVLLLMLLFSFFFSGMEIAFISASRLKIELKTSQGSRSAKILSGFKEKTSEVLITILIGNNIALVVFTMQMDNLTIGPFSSLLGAGMEWAAPMIPIIQAILGTLIILVFAEYIPKAIFRLNSNRIVYPAAYILQLFYYILYIPVIIVNLISKVILKYLFRLSTDEKVIPLSKQDMDEYILEVVEGVQSTSGAELDTEMLSNALAFKDTKTRECMIPRTEMKAVSFDAPIEELIALFIETRLSKIIIYEESLDQIKGFVHSTSMFSRPQKIAPLIQSVLVVPETMPANVLLAEFTENKRSVAIVVDEFGGTSGMVTIEDLVEEVFGEIEDEYDDEPPEEDMMQVNLGDGKYLLGARLEIDDLNEEFELNLPEEEYYTTLGGLVLYYAEKIPKKGEKVIVQHHLFTIDKAEKNRIITLKLEPFEP